MGLRSPQEMQKVQLRQEGSTRFNAGAVPQINKGFVNVLENKATNDEAQRVKARELTDTVFSNEIERDVLIPAMAEVTQSEGLNAKDVADKKRAHIQKEIDKRLDKYPEDVRPYLQGTVQSKLTRFEQTAVPHVYGETRKVVDTEFKTNINNKMNEAIESSGSLEALGTKGLEIVGRAVESYGAQMGLSPDQIAFNKEKFHSETIRRSIEQQAAVGRIDKAEETLNALGSKLSPADKVKAYKLIASSKKEQGTLEASTLSDRAFMEKGENLAEVERYINSMATNDKVKSQAMAFAYKRHNAIKEQQKTTVENIKGKLNREFIDKGVLNPDLLRKLPVDEQTKLVDTVNKNRGELPKVTDWDAHEELLTRLQNSTSARNMRDGLIDSYRDRISAKDLLPLEKMYNRLKQKDSDLYAEGAKGLSPDRLNTFVGQLATEYKMSSKAERAKLKNLTLDAQENLLIQNDKITPREIQVEIRKLLKEKGLKTVNESSFFGLFNKQKLKANEDLVEKAPPVHPSAREALKAKYPHLDESQINAIIRLANEKNVDVSKPRKY